MPQALAAKLFLIFANTAEAIGRSSALIDQADGNLIEASKRSAAHERALLTSRELLGRLRPPC